MTHLQLLQFTHQKIMATAIIVLAKIESSPISETFHLNTAYQLG